MVEDNWERADAEHDSIFFSERGEKDHKLFVEILCDLLDQVIIENEGHAELIYSNILIAFQGPSRSFTASYYISRMSRYSGASPCCFIVALIYLDRFYRRVPYMRLNSRTLQRLLLVAVMTATKYIEDVPRLNSRWYTSNHRIHAAHAQIRDACSYSCSHIHSTLPLRTCSGCIHLCIHFFNFDFSMSYTVDSAACRAEIGGLPLRELNQLELEFLFALDFDLSVHPQDYALCVAHLPAAAARLAVAESSAARLATLPANGAAGCGAGAEAVQVCPVVGPPPAWPLQLPSSRSLPTQADAANPTLLAGVAEAVDTAHAGSRNGKVHVTRIRLRKCFKTEMQVTEVSNRSNLRFCKVLIPSFGWCERSVTNRLSDCLLFPSTEPTQLTGA